MNRSLPPYAIALGAAGLLPFIGCSLGALVWQGDWGDKSLLALLGYGTAILSFVGGVHWGFALLDPSASDRAQRARFGLGVVPSLIGWSALLVTFIGLPRVGLAVLLAGFIATTATEARASRAGLMPHSYMWLRWALSAGAIVCLSAVLLVRAFGGRVTL